MKSAHIWIVMACAMVWGIMMVPRTAFAARRGVVYVQEGVTDARAEELLERIGVSAAELRRIDQLQSYLQIVSMVPDLAKKCDETLDVIVWSLRVEEARGRIQLMDFAGALADLTVLEQQMNCLVTIPEAEDLFEFHLGVAEARLLMAQAAAEQDNQRHHQERAQLAMRRAASFGSGIPSPPNLAPEVQVGLAEIRAAMSRGPGTRVRVVAPQGDVWIDGHRLEVEEGTFVTVPGVHLIQRVRDGEVVSTQVTEVAPGRGVLVWAGAAQDALTLPQLQRVIWDLGLSGRAHAMLGPALDTMGVGGPAMLVTADGERTQIWETTGEQIRLKLSDPPQAGRQVTSDLAQRDFGFSVGASVAESGLSRTENYGVQLGGRIAVIPEVVVAFEVGVLGQGMPKDVQGWPMQGLLIGTVSPRWRSPDRIFDAGIEMGAMWGIHATGEPVVPLMGFGGSLATPPRRTVGVRLDGTVAWAGDAGRMWIGGLFLDLS